MEGGVGGGRCLHKCRKKIRAHDRMPPTMRLMLFFHMRRRRDISICSPPPPSSPSSPPRHGRKVRPQGGAEGARRGRGVGRGPAPHFDLVGRGPAPVGLVGKPRPRRAFHLPADEHEEEGPPRFGQGGRGEASAADEVDAARVVGVLPLGAGAGLEEAEAVPPMLAPDPPPVPAVEHLSRGGDVVQVLEELLDGGAVAEGKEAGAVLVPRLVNEGVPCEGAGEGKEGGALHARGGGVVACLVPKLPPSRPVLLPLPFSLRARRLACLARRRFACLVPETRNGNARRLSLLSHAHKSKLEVRGEWGGGRERWGPPKSDGTHFLSHKPAEAREKMGTAVFTPRVDGLRARRKRNRTHDADFWKTGRSGRWRKKK